MKTLIKAYDLEDGDLPRNIFLFICEHAEGINVVENLGRAFRNWYVKTPEGKDHVDDEGLNFGDAEAIPSGFLKREGIYSYLNAGIDNFMYLKDIDADIVVNYNDNLFDLGEADEE